MHVIDYVVSYGPEPVKEPWLPDEEEFNRIVGSDYCSVYGPGEDLVSGFSKFMHGLFGDDVVVDEFDGHARATIRKGAVREFVEGLVDSVRSMAEEMTADNYTSVAYRINTATDGVNPFCTTFVELWDSGTESCDSYQMSLASAMRDNDAGDIVIHAYGYINHHI